MTDTDCTAERAAIRARLDAAYESPFKALEDENRALRLKLKKAKRQIKAHKARALELKEKLVALGKGEEEWAVRVFTRADQSHWFHQDAEADSFEADLAMTIEVAANSIAPVTGEAPVNHGFAVVKRTVWSSEWETVKTVPATGEPTTALDVERAEELTGPDTLCPCGKVNDGTGSGYCSYEHFDKYDGWNL